MGAPACLLAPSWVGIADEENVVMHVGCCRQDLVAGVASTAVALPICLCQVAWAKSMCRHGVLYCAAGSSAIWRMPLCGYPDPSGSWAKK